ncbi:hypothetical protein RJ641_025195 [Dillenia turbinata]|uniref:Uncharacterized protein n=1 Tax=Dillenia turbinata TaxID=194707 RepID=A0AAN8W0D8_9MAGN
MESTPTLKRRNSIPTSTVVVPSKLNLPIKPQSSSFNSNSNGVLSAVDFELVPLNSLSYTSIRDLLPPSPSGIHSPTSASCVGAAACGQISIRNRLVKQAAWAYLQPMSTSPDSAVSGSGSGFGFFHRLWIQLSGETLKHYVKSCFAFISRAFNHLLRVFRFR